MQRRFVILLFWLLFQGSAAAQYSWKINFNYSKSITSVESCIEDSLHQLTVAGVFGDDYGNKGFFVARADSQGNLLWSDSSSCAKVTLAGVVALPDSSLLVAVTLRNKPAIVQGTVVSGLGFYTTVLLRYGRTGAILSYGRLAHCLTKKIQATTSGSVILYGSYTDSAVFENNFHLGDIGLFLAVADRNLNVQYAKKIGEWQEVDVCALGLNQKIYAGMMDSNVYRIKQYDLALTEYPDLWIWSLCRPVVNIDGSYILTDQSSLNSLDPLGNVVWSKNLSQLGYPQTHVDFPHDRVYCSTGFSLTSGDVGTDITSWGIEDQQERFTWRLNDVSARPFSSTENETYAYGMSKATSLLSVGTLIRREGIPTTVSSVDIQRWSVLPIPAHESLTIRTVPEMTITKVNLFTLTGEQTIITTLKEKDTLDVSHLAAGVYILVVNTANERRVFKIIKD